MMIRVNNLTVSFNSHMVFKNISFLVERGTLSIIKGKNGSGKSTLLHAIAGIIPRYIEGEVLGEIIIGGKNLRDLSFTELVAKVGIVFQDPDNMLISSTVIDDLAFAPENLCIERGEMIKRVEDALNLTLIAPLSNFNSLRLSGGEKQRVALASVLTQGTEVILLDEAMSALDNASRRRIIDIILKLKAEGKTIIAAEHNNDLFALSDKIIDLDEIR